MADGFIHTVWKDGEWQNEVEGGDPIPGPSGTRKTPKRLDAHAHSLWGQSM